MSTETVPLPDLPGRRPQVVAATVRGILVVVAALLGVAADRPWRTFAWLVPAALLGAYAASRPRTGWRWRAALAGELVVATTAIPVTGGSRSAMLPYLLAPMFALGFRSGARYVAWGGVLVAALLVAGLPLDPVRGDRGDYLVAATQWSMLGVAFGLVAAWARQLAAADDPVAQYAQVSRLLAELRGMARRLPGSLDPVSAADTLLDDCRAVTAYDRAAVLVPAGTDRLTPLAVRGAERLDVPIELTGDGAVARAWVTRAAVRETGRRVRSGMTSLAVVPVPSDAGCTGLLVLEAAADGAFPAAVLQQVASVAIAGASRLESALLFDELRSIATVEERRRVAREIHDGIAQELVYVGYELDALRAELDAATPAARESVRRTREHVTRIISELRLSIFTLRASVGSDGLGAALGEFVRTVARQAGIAVHVSLSEDPARLPADAEAELLRIAQDAVADARKQPDTRNLWVTLEVDPPYALLRVEDDGTGDGHDRAASDIMRERAERLGAVLRVTPRRPVGTCVEVEVGGTTR